MYFYGKFFLSKVTGKYSSGCLSLFIIQQSIDINNDIALKSLSSCFSIKLFPFYGLVERVFSKSCGNSEGTKPYPDKSPQLQHLQVCLQKHASYKQEECNYK